MQDLAVLGISERLIGTFIKMRSNSTRNLSVILSFGQAEKTKHLLMRVRSGFFDHTHAISEGFF